MSDTLIFRRGVVGDAGGTVDGSPITWRREVGHPAPWIVRCSLPFGTLLAARCVVDDFGDLMIVGGWQ